MPHGVPPSAKHSPPPTAHRLFGGDCPIDYYLQTAVALHRPQHPPARHLRLPHLPTIHTPTLLFFHASCIAPLPIIARCLHSSRSQSKLTTIPPGLLYGRVCVATVFSSRCSSPVQRCSRLVSLCTTLIDQLPILPTKSSIVPQAFP